MKKKAIEELNNTEKNKRLLTKAYNEVLDKNTALDEKEQKLIIMKADLEVRMVNMINEKEKTAQLAADLAKKTEELNRKEKLLGGRIEASSRRITIANNDLEQLKKASAREINPENIKKLQNQMDGKNMEIENEKNDIEMMNRELEHDKQLLKAEKAEIDEMEENNAVNMAGLDTDMQCYDQLKNMFEVQSSRALQEDSKFVNAKSKFEAQLISRQKRIDDDDFGKPDKRRRKKQDDSDLSSDNSDDEEGEMVYII